MGFIQPCFIRKNTQEIRARLNNLGYFRNREWKNYNDDNKRNFILVYGNTYSLLHVYYESLLHPLKKYGSIDCGTNEELFLAIAALRDDDISLNDKINEINKKYGTKIEFRR